MKLDIVIPVHNQHKYYSECLFSIFMTYPISYCDILVHVIDMASDPPIGPIPHDNYPNIEAVLTRFDENKGVTFPWNYGLKKAMDGGADVICICNSDVVFGVKAIEHCLRAIMEHKKLVVFPYTNQGGGLPPQWLKLSEEKSKAPLYQSMVDTGGFAGWCFFLSRELVEKIGYFDDRFVLWYQDTDYHWRMAEKKIRPLEIRNCIIHHYESKSILGLQGGFGHQGWRSQDEREWKAKWHQD